MYIGLSLDQAPPYQAPIKFFLTAPIFAIISGVFAFFANSFEIHDPYIIATLHLITIGFIIMTIIGALQQMLPVIAGAIIPNAKRVSNITYVLLVLGLLFFTFGFVFYEKLLFLLASLFLASGLLYFTIIALIQLVKVENKSYIVQGIIISLAFFLIAFLLGIFLLIENATANITELHYNIALLHYNYIFFGFVFLLIVSITIQVVPMFWVTNNFSKNEQMCIIFSTTLLLVVYPLNVFLHLELDIAYKLIFGAIIFYFIFLTIQKLQQRKRKLKDITVYFYTTSMIFLAIGMVYWVMMSFFTLPANLFALIVGLGFIISLMNGMLYKIVPFLTWFHLNAQGMFEIPTIREMIPIKNMQTQYILYVTSVMALCVGLSLNSNIITKFAILVFIVSNILLFINLYKVTTIYKIHNTK
ncbi:MAG: hypothetical protein WBG69_03615 [Arcobacteraceae bacterium]